MLTASILGSVVGAGIGLLTSTCVLFWARRYASQAVAAGASVAYREPNWSEFVKMGVPLVAILIFLH